MPEIELALPAGALPSDYVFEQGRTYGNEPTFLYLNTGYPKRTTASVRIDAGDYPWNFTAQAPYCVAWRIPVIVANEALRELLQGLVPLFQTVAAGLTVDPAPAPPTDRAGDPDLDNDLARPVGTQRLSDAAEQARHRIADELAAAFASWPRVEIRSMNFTPEREFDLEQRIKPDDERYPGLAALAETLRAATPPVSPGNHVVMPGLLDQLCKIRDRLRERELQKLTAIANTIQTAAADRDRLLNRASAWKDTGGTTSQRALAERAGLTHRGVGKILARERIIAQGGLTQDLAVQQLPELSDAEVGILRLDGSTPEQRYRWETCEHPGARVHLMADTEIDDDHVRAGLPVRVVDSSDSDDLARHGKLRSDWAVGTCGTCGGPVSSFTLRTADGTWQTPWVLLGKHGESDW